MNQYFDDNSKAFLNRGLKMSIHKCYFEVFRYEDHDTLLAVILCSKDKFCLKFICDSIGQSIVAYEWEDDENYKLDMKEDGTILILEEWQNINLAYLSNKTILNYLTIFDDLNEPCGVELILSNNSKLRVFNLGDQLMCDRS